MSGQSERARHLRLSLGFKKPGQFAKCLGVSPARWNNVEYGCPLSRDLALIIGQKIPGFTAEWIWTGNDRLLTVELARLLGLVPARRARQ